MGLLTVALDAGSCDNFLIHCVELQQLNTGQLQDIDFGHQFDRVKSVDDEENNRSAKQDGLEKRQKQKRETEMEMREQWFEEVHAIFVLSSSASACDCCSIFWRCQL